MHKAVCWRTYSISTDGKRFRHTVEAPSTNGHPPELGKIFVTFSELPVHDWHELSNEEKREKGIANGAGVSVVRAEREIDYGWFFMGGKRRENYDDWWRCEVRFDPVLDEVFGITHTKQQIRPRDYLLEILSPDMENLAKALNSRVRQAHFQVRAADRTVEVEQLATKRDNLLKPLPKIPVSAAQQSALKQLLKRHPAIREDVAAGKSEGTQYRILHEDINDSSFYSFVIKDGLFILVLNPDHPFFRRMYRPLIESDNKEMKELRGQLDLLLLACARAEAAATRDSQRETLTLLRKAWSDNLATFLNG